MPQFKIIIEKKDLLSIFIDTEDVKDALKIATQLVMKNYPVKENLRIIDDIKVLETPLNISVIGTPESLSRDKKKLIIETKGN
jgi:hypothetical protein